MASCAAKCADPPNPNTPSRPPSGTFAQRNARYPMIPAHSSGAACSSSKASGIG
jgi:hypothetical protein